MAVERTFSIVKPDAVAKNLVGEIYSRFERNGLMILAAKMLRLSEEQAQGFYVEHAGRPFYDDLVAYMTSGPVVVQVLEGESAVDAIRDLLGPTDSTIAPRGTIRGDLGESSMKNICHASDSAENAATEVERFFDASEVC